MLSASLVVSSLTELGVNWLRKCHFDVFLYSGIVLFVLIFDSFVWSRFFGSGFFLMFNWGRWRIHMTFHHVTPFAAGFDVCIPVLL